MDSNQWLAFQMITYHCQTVLPLPTRIVVLYWTVLASAIALSSELTQCIFSAHSRDVIFVNVRGFVYRLSVDNIRLSAPILVLGASWLKATLAL